MLFFCTASALLLDSAERQIELDLVNIALLIVKPRFIDVDPESWAGFKRKTTQQQQLRKKEL